jgi:hypothetical protein
MRLCATREGSDAAAAAARTSHRSTTGVVDSTRELLRSAASARNQAREPGIDGGSELIDESIRERGRPRR